MNAGMSAPYIPTADADFGNWIDNFSTMLTASPTTYGLVAADAVVVAGVTATWDSTYSSAIDPSTRTPVTIAAKDDAKTAALATCRPYAQQIANNAGVSPSNKIAIGVNPRTNGSTPVPTPLTTPLVSVPSLGNLTHVLRYRDELASPTSKAKPAGAIAMQIFGKASATPITDPNALTFLSQQTKSPFQVDLDPGDVGKQMYYVGRWVTRTGKVGPFGPIVSATIAAA